ncbi:AraC family transcriptional regulator [Streptococcus criceti]|uniref:HTH araC/xylS-type domain-containing protein n=1 Tax=Streptococcus criceti HS-6 TaxID=873449 RepID=G5JS91_STRCG|nr:AraC family transcriptional regulator [Streptococcus criceti]EHI73573.1 hypothetical protein STRCR_0869 [Streptococcus criceti HS-6]SUN37450.1 AraC family transcriptional regulator [Streptococcus criceti]
MKLAVTRGLEDYLKTLGLDFSSLLHKATIPNKLRNEEIELTSLEYFRLLDELDRVLDEKEIRALSQIANLQLLVPAFFAALSAKNGLEALERFAHFKKLVGPIEVELMVTELSVSVHFSYALRQFDLPKLAVLNEQLLLLNLLKTGTGQSIQPILLESPFDYEEETLAEFGQLVQKSTYNQLVFARVDLDQPFITQNNIMWHYLEPELNKHLASLEGEKSFATYVQEELLSAIPAGNFLVEDIAQRLGLSSRTLQRNLKAENTSFKEQVQAVQKAMAVSYLQLNLSTEEIADLLGYTEVAAFSRAFKKWLGMTVTDYRKRLLVSE